MKQYEQQLLRGKRHVVTNFLLPVISILFAIVTVLLVYAANRIKQLQDAGNDLASGIRSGHWDNPLDSWEEICND